MKNIKNYLIPILIWTIIFGKNIFSKLLFVDYIIATKPFLINNLILTNYTTAINILNILRDLFTTINLSSIFFQIIILVGFIITSIYINKLTKHHLLTTIIFLFNPFIYTKIMIGQLGILIAYLLIPLLIYQIKEKNLLKIILTLTIIGSLTPHFLILSLIITAIGLFKKITLKQLIKYSIILLLLNIFWLQGMFAGGMLEEIDTSHEDFFKPTITQNVPAIAKIIGMWGFWREAAHETSYNILPLPIWYLAVASLVILLITSYHYKREEDSKLYYILFWIGLIFGVGAAHPLTSNIFNYLFNNLPFFNGFRDSHKFTALIALAYAFLIPKLTKTNLQKALVLIPIILLTFPLITIPVTNTDYPESYEELNTYLNTKEIKGHIIYFPWQQYLSYTWTSKTANDGRIGNPINEITNLPVIEGPDQYGGNSGLKLKISNCKDNKQCLKDLGVQYIIKDNCAIFPDKYEWLTNEEYKNDCIQLYNIDGTKQKQEIPVRFIISTLISLLTFIYVVKKILSKKQAKQQKHK
jgi:hypothetical protein